MKRSLFTSELLSMVERSLQTDGKVPVMAKSKLSILLCALMLSVGSGMTASRADDQGEECKGTPMEAVMQLPAPLRKWGQINCTPYGHSMVSRTGWVWASLDDGAKVRIPSQISRGKLAEIGNSSYFTSVHETQVTGEDRTNAAAVFEIGLNMKDEASNVYRVELTSVSGNVMVIYFFDFGSFAGGMWCPADGCVPESRFLIMEQDEDHKPHSPSV